MNRERRRKIAKILQKFREKSGKTMKEMAIALGWDDITYDAAELGSISLSEGQQNDIRRVMKAGIQAAAIRDRLRKGGNKKLWTRGSNPYTRFVKD